MQLAQINNGNGYFVVRVMGVSKSVHRLVASAFIPNPKKHCQVNHIDFDRQNNSHTNLEWCSAKENNDHSRAAGRHHVFEQKSKLTDADVSEIFKMIGGGYKQWQVAAKFGVTQGHISHLVIGRRRKGCRF